MNKKKEKAFSQIASKMKSIFLNYLASPFKTEIIEMILTAINFLEVILSEIG